MCRLSYQCSTIIDSTLARAPHSDSRGQAFDSPMQRHSCSVDLGTCMRLTSSGCILSIYLCYGGWGESLYVKKSHIFSKIQWLLMT